jgi:cytochrome c biogenesis protein CcdA
MKILHILAALINIGTDPSKGEVNIPKVDSATVWGNILNTTYYFAGVVAVFVLIYAGMRYILARGKEENIVKAKNTIIYAISGLIVILLAFIITNFVLGSLTGK